MNISIGKKIFISFFLLNTLVFLFLIILTVNLFQKNNNKFIEFDLIKTKVDVLSYIEQYIQTNKIGLLNTIDERKLDLLSELNLKLNGRGAIYDINGNMIPYDDFKIDIFEKEKGDVLFALKNNASYTIFEREHLVAFSIPVFVGGKMLFVYRMEKDYSSIFNTSDYFSRVVIIFGGISLLFVFMISLLVSRNITRPILKLKEFTNKIALKDYDVDIDIKSRDEVYDLANNFKIMQKRVRDHINTIEKDKDLLKELLEQRKNFFDSVTHELKTPLTTIQGYTQLLARNGFKDQDFLDKGLTHILEESIRLHKMVLSLLELSEQNTINVKMDTEIIDISELIEKVCTDMEIKARNYDVSIETNIDSGLFIRGCKGDLKGLFINLIDNAIKYSGSKSTIRVTTMDKADYIEAVIRDNGAGIPEDKLEMIFEPFYRVNNEKSKGLGSSGLGLSIVKKIVENHKGEVNIESSVTTGTMVTVKLPKTNDKQEVKN